LRYLLRMPDLEEKLTPADASDIAESVAFALLFSGKKRVHDSDRMTASIAAQRIVRHLEKCGYVLMKRPPIGGSAPLNPPPGWPHTKL
jgi:hypothetical protein